ncbi:MAG: chemotaxis-specific protein-glutamate methyltransferase CheB [Lachnospiraceae bacterium]
MKKNILVVDDSALMRRVICDIINSDNTFQATDVCRDGLEAYEKLKKNRYAAVVLDVNMPKMDGLQLLEKLQKEKIAATVIMVSTSTTKDADVTILAMERGAVDFVAKPYNIIEAKGEEFKGELLGVLNAVIRTGNMDRLLAAPKTQTTPVMPKSVTGTRTKAGKKKLVALACSTGGPKALQSVIPYLPPNMDAPMVLVQHMPAGFTKSMAERLNEISSIKVKEAADGELLQKGFVYVAPGGKHMEVVKAPGGGHKISLNDRPPIGGLRPCANITYESLKNSGYDEVTCVVLTGMGADGTQGILSLKKSKPVHIIAQNAQTCVVYGMPKAIAETGIVNEVVSLTEIAQTIIKNVGVQ